ncbi:MAG TPA: hypothetical protein VIY27_11185 [Myxococcota bacterium]
MSRLITHKLDEWLAKHNARCLWQQKVDGVGWVDCYAIGTGIAHVTRYRRDDSGAFDGWDIYVAAAPGTNNIDETLAAAEAALGLGIEASL